MKRKQLEALARCGYDAVQTAPTLSELSISEIRQLLPSEESIEVENDRELIRHFPKNADSEADNYGIRQFAVVSFAKKRSPMMREQSNINLNGCSELSSEQESMFKSREKSLSFNKELKRKRKSLKKPERYKQSAGSQINKKTTQSPTIGKIKNSFDIRKAQEDLAPSKIAQPTQISFKLPKPEIRTHLDEQPINLLNRGKAKEDVLNPYYLRPDDFKFQINDIHSEFSNPKNFSIESPRMERSGHLSRDLKNSRQNPLNYSNSTNGFSEDYQTLSKNIRNISKSEKVIEVKRQKSFDYSRESFISQKAVDSPFSRDSTSTTANGLNSSSQTKYGSEYYTEFKRGSK